MLGQEALASATTEDLVAAIDPTVPRYLTGDIGSGCSVPQCLHLDDSGSRLAMQVFAPRRAWRKLCLPR